MYFDTLLYIHIIHMFQISLVFTWCPFSFFLSFFFWLHRVACWILVPRPGIEPTSSALKVWSLHHWTAREVPLMSFFCSRIISRNPILHSAVMFPLGCDSFSDLPCFCLFVFVFLFVFFFQIYWDRTYLVFDDLDSFEDFWSGIL